MENVYQVGIYIGIFVMVVLWMRLTARFGRWILRSIFPNWPG